MTFDEIMPCVDGMAKKLQSLDEDLMPGFANAALAMLIEDMAVYNHMGVLEFIDGIKNAAQGVVGEYGDVI